MKLACFIMHLAWSVTPLGKGVSVYLHASFSPSSPLPSLAAVLPCAQLSPRLLGTEGAPRRSGRRASLTLALRYGLTRCRQSVHCVHSLQRSRAGQRGQERGLRQEPLIPCGI